MDANQHQLPSERIRRFEKDLKSRTKIRFHLEVDAVSSVKRLSYSLLDALVQELLEKEEIASPTRNGKKHKVSVFQVEQVLGGVKSLPGFMDVPKARNYESVSPSQQKGEERRWNPLLYRDNESLQQEDV